MDRAARSDALRGGVVVEVEEIDILDEAGEKTRSEECDLLREDVYGRLRTAASGGAYFAVVAGIPCNTYCVQQLARADGAHDGPRTRRVPASIPTAFSSTAYFYCLLLLPTSNTYYLLLLPTSTSTTYY